MVLDYIVRNKTLALLAIIVILIFSNIIMFYHYENKYSLKFDYVSPSIAWMDVNDFLNVQNKFFVQFNPLKESISEYINSSAINGTYGIYFEDLNTGAWIGINEREEFVPLSLLKVPVMVAILKKVEEGEFSLDRRVFITKEDLNSRSGTLAEKGVGYSLTVKELLTYMIKESDNTALAALHRSFLNDYNILEARLAMGLPVDPDGSFDIGPKHYSNILRSLYYSAYLRRTFSEIALSIMSETKYNSQIRAGVPEDIPVSHKVGFMYDENDNLIYFHDCGIVYHPKKPYILCIMSAGASQREVDSTMSNISKLTYEYVDAI